MAIINTKSLQIGVLTIALGLGAVACQRNPQNVQASREENAFNANNTNKDQLMTPADGAFMKKAEDADIQERDLGRVMMNRSQNSDVRDYAKMLADDHDKDLRNVVNLEEDKGIHQPKDMVQVNNDALAELNKLSGPAMDKRFMEMMVQDHQKDVAEYTKEEQAGEDPAVRDYAAHALTTLDKHLKKAQDVQQKLEQTSDR